MPILFPGTHHRQMECKFCTKVVTYSNQCGFAVYTTDEPCIIFKTATFSSRPSFINSLDQCHVNRRCNHFVVDATANETMFM